MKDSLRDFQLFIHTNEPVFVYLIENKPIAFHPTLHHIGSWDYAYAVLEKLATNPVTRRFLPSELLNIVKNNSNVEDIRDICLCGSISYGVCIVAKLTINDNNAVDKIVRLSDFALINDEAPPNHLSLLLLPGEVFLTPLQSYFLFANICLSMMGLALEPLLNQPLNKLPLKKEKLVALYRQSYENTKSPFGSVRERIITFCIDYVNYLRTQIAKRALDFEIVFQLSGPRVLTFYLKDFPEVQAFVLDKITVLLENHSILSSAQQISYLTLLLLAKQLEFSPEILALYERHQDLIATFIEKHTKLLPDEELDIIKERDEVFNFYLK